MGLFKRIYESFFKKGTVKISSNVARPYGDLATTELYQLLQEIKAISQERKTRLSEYRSMLADGVTLSAIELMAEDATQPDPERMQSIWVTCPQYPTLEKEINKFLQNNVNIETNIYAIAFNLAAFGDAYLSTFYSDQAYKKSGNRIGDYFEIETAEFITHLFHYGKPSGFLVNKNENASRYQQDEQSILDEKDFIHFSCDNGLNYGKVAIQTQDQNGNEITQEFTVKYGNSFLEAARSYYKTLGLYKDLMMLARLTRSQFYRLVSVDVGQADDRETTRMIKEVRDVISNSQSIQPKQGINTLSSPMSTGGNVYFPTRNGKGSVSMETVGGDFNVSEMADLDYFDNAYYGALKVPKQFLGQSEDLPSGLGESSLTRLDIRYARTIKRLQKAIKEGINKLILWKFNLDGFNLDFAQIPEYTINMHPISSAEQLEMAEATEQLNTKITNLLDIIERVDEEGNINKYQLLPFIIEKFNLPEDMNKIITDNINRLINNNNSSQQEQQITDSKHNNNIYNNNIILNPNDKSQSNNQQDKSLLADSIKHNRYKHKISKSKSDDYNNAPITEYRR